MPLFGKERVYRSIPIALNDNSSCSSFVFLTTLILQNTVHAHGVVLSNPEALYLNRVESILNGVCCLTLPI